MMRNVSIPAGTRRWPIIVIGILILLFIGFTVMSGFYVDLLWFREVELSSVFWSVLRTKAVLGIIFGLLFFALLYVNLLIVRWLTPTTRILTPEQEAVDRVRQSLEPYLRWLIPLAVAALALVVGLGVSRQWEVFLLWRNGSGLSFGSTEPIFNRDPAFYVFSLPWLRFVQGWLFSSLVGVTLIVGIAHFVWGGIQPQAPAFADKVDPAVRAHLSVLLGLIMLTKAWGYYLGRFDLLTSPRGVGGGRLVHGCEGAVARAELPGDRGGDLCRAVPGEHPRAPVELARDRGRAAGLGVGAVGHGLPGVRTAVQREAAGTAARVDLHRLQHRRHATSVPAGLDRDVRAAGRFGRVGGCPP